MSHGWIKLYRSLKKHWLFTDAEMLRVWIAILLKASHKDRSLLFNGQLVLLQRGTLVLSKLALAERLALTRPRLDRILGKLERDQMIVQRTSSRSTVISVVNYDKYQVQEWHDRATDVTSGVQATSIEHAATEQPACTNNNVKKDNNNQEGRESHPLEDHFMPIEDGAEWMRNRQYTHAGRRPLWKYPDLFLAPDELADVFEQLAESGIPSEQFKLVFKRVDARLKTAKAEGKSLEFVSAYNWLTGWAKEEVVRELTASNNLERSRVYLVGGNR